MASVIGTIKIAELNKCDICLVSRYCVIIESPLLYKNGDYDIWYSPGTLTHNCSLQLCSTISVKVLVFIEKKTCNVGSLKEASSSKKLFCESKNLFCQSNLEEQRKSLKNL